MITFARILRPTLFTFLLFFTFGSDLLHAITNCHDFCYYSITGQDRNRLGVDDFRKLLEANKYAPTSYTDITKLKQDIKPGDVLIIGNDHSGIVNSTGGIDHLLQDFVRLGVGRPYSPADIRTQHPKFNSNHTIDQILTNKKYQGKTWQLYRKDLKAAKEPTEIDVLVTVFHDRTAHRIPGAHVNFEGQIKTAPHGVVGFRLQKIDTVHYSISARGYDSTSGWLSWKDLAKKVDKKKNVAELEFYLKQIVLDVVVTVLDAKTNQKIPKADVEFNNQTKRASKGVTSFKVKITDDPWFQATASNYTKTLCKFTWEELMKDLSKKTNKSKIEIRLSPYGKALIEVVDAESGDKIEKASVTLFGSTKETGKNGVAAFQPPDIVHDKRHEIVTVSAKAEGYRQVSQDFPISSLVSPRFLPDPYYKDKVTRLELVKLEKAKAASEYDLVVTVIDKESGHKVQRSKVTVSANVPFLEPILQTETKDTPDGTARFKRSLAELDPSTGGVKIDIAAEAKGYIPKTESLTLGKLSKRLDKDRKVVRLEVALEPKKSRIHVTKIPNDTNIKPGDSVTYTYRVRNPGNDPLAKVNITDDTCKSVNPLLGGDTNNDGKLDPGETWEYECTMSLNADTTNTATVTGEDSSGKKVTATATATVNVRACPPPQVKVPYLLYMTQAEATGSLNNSNLSTGAIKGEYSIYFAAGQVMEQDPYDGECVDPNSAVDMVISLGPKPEEAYEAPAAELRAELDCGDAFELAPRDFMGKDCNVVVRGWRSNTRDRVKVEIDYDKDSGIEVTPGNQSESPFNMFTPGVVRSDDAAKRYVFFEGFRAGDDAPEGTTPITITVSQKGAGEVTLNLDVAVLPKGLTPSGFGIRPPPTVTSGTGGQWCVWRQKMFAHPDPRCFHFVSAVCTDGSKTLSNGYELIGENMPHVEADALVSKMSVYQKNEYGCDEPIKEPEEEPGEEGKPPKPDETGQQPEDIEPEEDVAGCVDGSGRIDTDCDGVADVEDQCPGDPLKTKPGKCGCGSGYGDDEPDYDEDRTPDCIDICWKNPDKIEPGICGCDHPDVDSDKDGTYDCDDRCPDNPDKIDPGECGCDMTMNARGDCIPNKPTVDIQDVLDAFDERERDRDRDREIREAIDSEHPDETPGKPSDHHPPGTHDPPGTHHPPSTHRPPRTQHSPSTSVPEVYEDRMGDTEDVGGKPGKRPDSVPPPKYKDVSLAGNWRGKCRIVGNSSNYTNWAVVDAFDNLIIRKHGNTYSMQKCTECEECDECRVSFSGNTMKLNWRMSDPVTDKDGNVVGYEYVRGRFSSSLRDGVLEGTGRVDVEPYQRGGPQWMKFSCSYTR